MGIMDVLVWGGVAPYLPYLRQQQMYAFFMSMLVACVTGVLTTVSFGLTVGVNGNTIARMAFTVMYGVTYLAVRLNPRLYRPALFWVMFLISSMAVAIIGAQFSSRVSPIAATASVIIPFIAHDHPTYQIVGMLLIHLASSAYHAVQRVASYKGPFDDSESPQTFQVVGGVIALSGLLPVVFLHQLRGGVAHLIRQQEQLARGLLVAEAIAERIQTYDIAGLRADLEEHSDSLDPSMLQTYNVIADDLEKYKAFLPPQLLTMLGGTTSAEAEPLTSGASSPVGQVSIDAPMMNSGSIAQQDGVVSMIPGEEGGSTSKEVPTPGNDDALQSMATELNPLAGPSRTGPSRATPVFGAGASSVSSSTNTLPSIASSIDIGITPRNSTSMDQQVVGKSISRHGTMQNKGTPSRLSHRHDAVLALFVVPGLLRDTAWDTVEDEYEFVESAVVKHQGEIESVMGDTILAAWNVTVGVRHASTYATRCAAELHASRGADGHGGRIIAAVGKGSVNHGVIGTASTKRFVLSCPWMPRLRLLLEAARLHSTVVVSSEVSSGLSGLFNIRDIDFVRGGGDVSNQVAVGPLMVHQIVVESGGSAANENGEEAKEWMYQVQDAAMDVCDIVSEATLKFTKSNFDEGFVLLNSLPFRVRSEPAISALEEHAMKCQKLHKPYERIISWGESAVRTLARKRSLQRRFSTDKVT